MKRNVEEIKAEAVKRMEMLGMHRNTITDFKNGVLNLSEGPGLLYWLSGKEKQIVKEFEEDGSKTAYHIIHSSANIGELYNILYVSHDDEEWRYDMEDLKAGQVFAYVQNESCPDCSEYGSIGIKSVNGGVMRVW